MRCVIQRVSSARVSVENETRASIGRGLLILVGFSAQEREEDFFRMAGKIVKLRIFEDEKERIHFSVRDIDGDILLVSQFTLYADLTKGHRPSFNAAGNREEARVHFDHFQKILEESFGKAVSTGCFGARMSVESVNEGPFTLVTDQGSV